MAETDRSGRTLKEYRELYWAEKKRRKELEAVLIDAERDWEDERRKVRELESQLAAVRALPYETMTNQWGKKREVVDLEDIRVALAGEEDE
jgi:hypothetical protein